MGQPKLFLESLYREFEIVVKGILVDIPTETSGKIWKIIKGILIAGTFYLPARCLVSGRGKYRCVKYFKSSETFKTACCLWWKCLEIYLFNKDDPSGPA